MQIHTDDLMKRNPYRTTLAIIAGVLAGAAAFTGLAGVMAQNATNDYGDELAGVVQFAWAHWLFSGAALAFMFWLAVSGVSWAVMVSRPPEVDSGEAASK